MIEDKGKGKNNSDANQNKDDAENISDDDLDILSEITKTMDEISNSQDHQNDQDSEPTFSMDQPDEIKPVSDNVEDKKENPEAASAEPTSQDDSVNEPETPKETIVEDSNNESETPDESEPEASEQPQAETEEPNGGDDDSPRRKKKDKKKEKKAPKEKKKKEHHSLFWLIGHKKIVTVAFVLWLNVVALLVFLFCVFRGFLDAKQFWYVLGGMVVFDLLLLLLVRCYKTSIIINSLLAIVLAVASFYSSSIVTKVQNYITQQQTDYVYVITRNDGSVTKDDDFYFYRYGVIADNDYYNNWGLTLLNNAGKTTNLLTENYETAADAYTALANKEIEVMSVSSADLSAITDDERYADTVLQYSILYQDKTTTTLDLNPVNLSSEPFLLYVAGIDISGCWDITGKGRSDVNILIAFNPNTGKASMQFVPRDTWVNVPCDCCSNKKTKLNRAMDYGGTSCALKTIETYFDIDINYYVKVNFYTVVKVVDALGGITVYNDEAFTCKTTNYMHENRKYSFKKGYITLNGDEALTYARERKAFASGTKGDLKRGQHQMQVIQACLDKFTQNISVDTFMNLLSATEGTIATNFSQKDMLGLLNVYSKIHNSLEIKTYTMKGKTTDTITDPVYKGQAYYFNPNEGEKEKVKARIEAVLNGQDLLAN